MSIDERRWRLSRFALMAGVALTACGPGDRARNDSMPEGPSCEVKSCSADARRVVCGEDVVEECRVDQVCDEGACVSACKLAADEESATGCDYYAVAPDMIDPYRNACFAAFIANTWDTPVSITVQRGGQILPIESIARIPQGHGASLTYAPLPDQMLPPGQVAILMLSGQLCPGGGGGGPDPALHGTGYGTAFRITTSAPVVAYDMYPYAGGTLTVSSATLLLPTSTWGRSYVGVNAFRKSTQVTRAQPTMAFVAAEDGTTVTIVPSASIEGGPGVASAEQGLPVSYPLARGQVLQFTQSAELSGSLVQSDKPIGAWGGASCLSIDVQNAACDSAHQQIPPVRALGDRYAAVRYPNRFDGQDEEVPWRLVGAVDGTVLTYSPAAPPGAPATLARGEVAELWTSGPFTIESQDIDHPFYMSAHMTGCVPVSPAPPPPPAPYDCRGDPEFVNVTPLDQHLTQYTFFTDPTFPETRVVLVRERTYGLFAEVTLSCAGVVTGWQPIDATGEIEYAYVSLATGNYAPVGGCNNGLHFASSTLPFGLMVWGWGSAATEPAIKTTANSYAYPAGGSLKAINGVILRAQP